MPLTPPVQQTLRRTWPLRRARKHVLCLPGTSGIRHPGLKKPLTPPVPHTLRTSPRWTRELERTGKRKTVPTHAPQAGVGPPRNKPRYYNTSLRARCLLRTPADGPRRNVPPWRSLRGGPGVGTPSLPFDSGDGQFGSGRTTLPARRRFQTVTRTLSPCLEPKFLRLVLCTFSPSAVGTRRPTKAPPRLRGFETTDGPGDTLDFVRKSCATLPQFFLSRDRDGRGYRANLGNQNQNDHSTDNLESSVHWPGGGLFNLSVCCLPTRAALSVSHL